MSSRQAFEAFVVFIKQQAMEMGAEDVILIFHNAVRFDLPLLKQEFARWGVASIPDSWLWVDTVPLIKGLVTTPSKTPTVRPIVPSDTHKFVDCMPAQLAANDQEQSGINLPFFILLCDWTIACLALVLPASYRAAADMRQQWRKTLGYVQLLTSIS